MIILFRILFPNRCCSLLIHAVLLLFRLKVDPGMIPLLVHIVLVVALLVVLGPRRTL